MPGTTAPITAVVATFAAIATPTLGASASTTRKPAPIVPVTATIFSTMPGPCFAARRRLRGMNTAMPMSWNGSTTAAMMPRSASFSANTSS